MLIIDYIKSNIIVIDVVILKIIIYMSETNKHNIYNDEPN